MVESEWEPDVPEYEIIRKQVSQFSHKISGSVRLARGLVATNKTSENQTDIIIYKNEGENTMEINIKRLDDKAKMPTRGSQYAAGLDLYARTKYGSQRIESGETKKIGTGIAMEIPEGYFGAIFARSGLAAKRGLRPANCVGVIDSDYRGEIIVALHNDTDKCESIHEGDRIAQIVIMPYLDAQLNEVDELTDSERQNGGFGSTGNA